MILDENEMQPKRERGQMKYKNSNIKEGQTSLGNDKGRPELGAIKPNKAVAFLNESESLGFERAK